VSKEYFVEIEELVFYGVSVEGVQIGSVRAITDPVDVDNSWTYTRFGSERDSFTPKHGECYPNMDEAVQALCEDWDEYCQDNVKEEG